MACDLVDTNLTSVGVPPCLRVGLWWKRQKQEWCAEKEPCGTGVTPRERPQIYK